MKKKMAAKRVDIVSIKLVKEKSVLYGKRIINSPPDGAKLANEFLESLDREVFLVAYLNVKNEPVALHILSIGTVDSTLVHPREVMKPAILSNASKIILFHNHPTGSLKPSEADKKITKRLEDAGVIMGIDVVDHIIIGDSNEYFSFKEGGLM